jgi:hypothetical protein
MEPCGQSSTGAPLDATQIGGFFQLAKPVYEKRPVLPRKLESTEEARPNLIKGTEEERGSEASGVPRQRVFDD